MNDKEVCRTNRYIRKQKMQQRRNFSHRQHVPCVSQSYAHTPLSIHLQRKRQRSGTSHMAIDYKASSSNVLVSDAPASTLDHGIPTYNCHHCGAIFWYGERVKSLSSNNPVFSICCRQGRVDLPIMQDPPVLLKELFSYNGSPSSKKFRNEIRLYNSVFAFTSIGGKVDKQINRGQGPYVFKINGQNHHLIGSLLPVTGEKPHFAQLYVYDTENEASNRMTAVAGEKMSNHLDESIISQMIQMFDMVNPLVKAFRMARDRFAAGEMRQVSLRLAARRSGDGVQYNTPAAPELAALIVGDIGMTDHGRDIVVEKQSKSLRRINDLHPSFMAMQYPVLFPYGEDGYRLNILYRANQDGGRIKRGHVTRREFYSYMLQQRTTESGLLIRGGKLYQQYIVDAFTSIEDERLRYIRYKHQQEHYRSEIYSGVQDAFIRGDVASSSVGQRVILPSSFTGSPRYMIHNYHDAMAICRSRGNPDLFITFTCNVHWNEIKSALDLIPGQRAEDRPDIVSRVFHMKLNEFVDDIKKGHYFGTVTGAVYTVEFQKRGLPHVHIIIWLNEADKYPTPIDMVHGPCGAANPRAPCMKNDKCIKHFPKKIQKETIIGEDGFAIYRRRDNGNTVTKSGVQLDNTCVVPYNKGLLIKYDAHINVEWCNRSRAIKYLFKYVNKGPDRTRALLQEIPNPTSNDSNSELQIVDEIKMYFDCRYVGPHESAWRIFEFHIHYKFPNVESLSIHLPLMNNVIFRGNIDVDQVLQRPGIEKTMLTEWMFTNSLNEDARQLTYAEFPSFWRWDGPNKLWFRRQRGDCIGRISYIHPSAGEVYYLRVLLSHVKGAQNFVDLRTVNGIIHQTFKQACNTMGLIGDDKEWHQAMDEASGWATSTELRSLFVTMLLFCEVTDAEKLFEESLEFMKEDIIFKLKRLMGISSVHIADEQVRNRVIIEVQRLLKKNNSCLIDHGLPEPTQSEELDAGNTILREEMAHNTNDLEDQNIQFSTQMNEGQRKVFNSVLDAVYGGGGGFFFLYGHGGTGKTFVYKAIINQLRSQGKIVIAVASSGVASLLLPGGRTAHSRFKIPIHIHDDSSCHIKKGTHLAELLFKSSLIVWDEAPMAHRHCFEASDRTLADIMVKDDELTNNLPFGGKTILLGGDFRQILPVVVKGSRHDTVRACITQSMLWKKCKVFHLTQNMRLSAIASHEQHISELPNFSKWLLDIGEGKAAATKLKNEEENPSWVKIPTELLVKSVNGDVEDITSEIYSDLPLFYKDEEYLKERAIITATNDIVDIINTHVLSLVPTEEKTYFSFDSIYKVTGSSDGDDILYPTEFLNSLTFNGIPNHELKLKVNTPFMLLRNINQTNGLCNGTRLLVTKLGERVVQATIITGSHIGDKICIPRIIMSATETKWPFTMSRRQFPLRLSYAMTINKSQGQTLAKVGLYLPRPVFTHGQLYVAASRVTNCKGLRILLSGQTEEEKTHTKNIVYKEIFQELDSGS